MNPLPADAAFFQHLREIDFEVFQEAKSKPCPLCGGSLDTAHFPRKPRGVGEGEERRFSLCCRQEGCRHRVTPPSLRFLGRKVYSAWVIILILNFSRELGLKQAIPRRTLNRWRDFWRKQLSETHAFMKRARGLLPPGAAPTQTPGPLLTEFGFPDPSSFVPILRFFTHPI